MTIKELKSTIKQCVSEILAEQDLTNPVAEDPKVQDAVKTRAVADRKVADAEISALNDRIRAKSQEEREAKPEDKSSKREQLKKLKDQLAAAILRKTTANKAQAAAK
jgi:hypothetical protein